MSHTRRFVPFVVLMSILVACGGDAEPTTTSEVSSAPSTTASDAPSTTGSSDEAATSTSEDAAATTTANTATPGETVEVSLRLDWLWGAEHAPYFVALEKGYYADAGLDVEILEGEGSTLSARLVGTGDNTFGVVSAGTVLASVSQGIPLQTIATLIQQTPSGIIYDQEQLPMESLEDLEGNALGVVVDSVTYLEWQSVARLNDLDVDSIDEVAVGENVVQAFLADRVQAATGWTFNQFLEVTLNGGNAGFLKFADAGLDVPGSTIVANAQTIQEQPEVVDSFVDATLKGWQFALDNPEETLEIFYSYEGEVDQEYNNEKLPLVLDLITPADGQPLGFSSPEAWENLKEVYASGDLLEEDVAVEDVITNEFVGE